MSFELKGADVFLRKLNKAAEVADVKNAVRINTAEMLANAQKNAPVDTGHLKRSILPDVTDLVGRVRATADYSPYVEYGTRFMSAQPFIGPAYYEQKPIFLKDLMRLVE